MSAFMQTDNQRQQQVASSLQTMCLQVAELASARVTAAKALALSNDPSRARCVELECILQAKNAQIIQLEVLNPSYHRLRQALYKL